MMLTTADGWGTVGALLRWRMRMLRNSIATDSGFLGVFMGGLFYLSMIVVVALQAQAGGMLTHELASDGQPLAIGLLGIHLFIVMCVQGAALYFFRISLQGDFRTARWRILPVGRDTLRRAYLIDSLINPGTIAGLIACWILVFGYARPTTASSVIACLAVSPLFVFLSQAMFIAASDLVDRYRVAAPWLLLVSIAAAGLVLSNYAVRLASGTIPAMVREIMGNQFTQIALRLPPWGLPLYVAQRVDSGRGGQLFAALVAALIGGSLLLAIANRVAANTEPN